MYQASCLFYFMTPVFFLLSTYPRNLLIGDSSTAFTKELIAKMNEVTNSAESTSSKRPGRPRKDGHDEKIIDATLRLIDSNRPVTVNAVVKESGVSRAAVYRRWPRLVDLVAEALDAGRAPVEIDTSGDIKETLIDGLFTNQAKTTGVSYPRQQFRKRLELVMSDQELQLAYWNSHVRRRREANIRALQVVQEKAKSGRI